MKRIILSSLFAFLFSFVFSLLLIPTLKKLKAGQNILSYVKEHEGKTGTPTMGGVGFISASCLATILFSNGFSRQLSVALTIGLAYLAVGILDDLLKKQHKENLGLKAWQKLLFQTAVAVFAGVYVYRANLTSLNLPFTDKKLNVGGWVVPLVVFVFLSLVNCVNLTDGLDGLASSVCIPYFLFFGVLIMLQGGEIPLAVLSFAIASSLVAFLIFNINPASVFMGDTGSLALGGFASVLAVETENALYVPLIGICFVFSGISVILQVIYYKVSKGKRIFLMAPVHHHFQMKGYSESKISYVYGVLTTLVGLILVLFLV